MIYVKDITTPADTELSSPMKTVLQVANGLVYKIELQFPPGSYGLLGVCIKDGSYQIWPSEDKTFFRGDDNLIAFDDLYLKSNPPFNFDIFTYNLDTLYEHEVIIRIGLVSKDVYLARFLPSIGYAEFTDMLKRLSDEQAAVLEAKREAIIANPLSWVTNGE
jgi:hypothetical protein